MRLCANTGCRLHLVEPLGFDLDEKRLRRAGLDYRDFASVRVHENWSHCAGALTGRIYALSTRGESSHCAPRFEAGDALVFGPETRGLPDELLFNLPVEQRLRIPMLPQSRSMNLSNAAAVVVYEAWRQQDFSGSGALTPKQ